MAERHEWTPPPGGGWNCGQCGVIWSDYSVHFDTRLCGLPPGHPGSHRPAHRSAECRQPIDPIHTAAAPTEQATHPAEVDIDTAEIRDHYNSASITGPATVDIEALCDEIDRLRAQITASYDVCSRSGGCIPGRPW